MVRVRSLGPQWLRGKGVTPVVSSDGLKKMKESGPVLTHWLLLGVLLRLPCLLRECLRQDLKFFIYFQEIKAGVLHTQGSST